VVALFSGGGNDKIERELQGLRKDVSELKKALEGQTTEIRQLSDRLSPVLPPLPKAGGVNAKE
jgi:predicted RNase H-like nuclease (RuvC/YqgF family)